MKDYDLHLKSGTRLILLYFNKCHFIPRMTFTSEEHTKETVRDVLKSQLVRWGISSEVIIVEEIHENHIEVQLADPAYILMRRGISGVPLLVDKEVVGDLTNSPRFNESINVIIDVYRFSSKKNCHSSIRSSMAPCGVIAELPTVKFDSSDGSMTPRPLMKHSVTLLNLRRIS